MAEPFPIAHRGNSFVAPENTMPAFEACAAAPGVSWIELDVRLTADGVPVIMHDAKVNRTTNGHGRLRDFAYHEVRALDAGSWFGPAFRGVHVPRFDEVVAFLSRPEHGGLRLLVEYKGSWKRRDALGTIRTLQEFGCADRALLQSFRPATVDAIRRADESLPRGLLVERWAGAGAFTDAKELGVAAVNPHWRLALHDGFVRRVHDLGATCAVWTVQDRTKWARLRKANVDAIITNTPAQLADWLRADAGAD